MPSRAKKQPAARSRAKASHSEHTEQADQHADSRSFWAGTISFGLVTIPIELFAATRTTRRSLRMLAPSGAPVARRYFTEDGEPVDDSALARGYQLDHDAYVVVTDEELERLAPEQSRDIDLSRFVDRAAIPPLFFERAYIMAPTGQSNAAYRLLAATLERTGKAGLASFVMRGKQYVVAIFGQGGLLRADTLRFADALRTPASVGLPAVVSAGDAQVRQMRALINKATTHAHADTELADTYWQRVEALVQKKQSKQEDFVSTAEADEPEGNLAEVIDLVAVLRKSLGERGVSSRAARASEARRPKSAAAGAAKKPAHARPAKKRAPVPRAKTGR